jgi:hypothetical protein
MEMLCYVFDHALPKLTASIADVPIFRKRDHIDPAVVLAESVMTALKAYHQSAGNPNS